MSQNGEQCQDLLQIRLNAIRKRIEADIDRRCLALIERQREREKRHRELMNEYVADRKRNSFPVTADYDFTVWRYYEPRRLH